MRIKTKLKQSYVEKGIKVTGNDNFNKNKKTADLNIISCLCSTNGQVNSMPSFELQV